MKITLLGYVEEEGSKDVDVVFEQVMEALKSKGHDCSVLGVHADLQKMVAGLRRKAPDLVFNLLEDFAGGMLGGLIAATAVLDLLRIPYTGGSPGEIFLQEDKGLSKKLLAFDEILYPHYATFAQDSAFETAGRLRMPLFVKPLRNDASIGIDGKKSLVRSTTDLMERVLSIHKDLKDAALVEEYIEGREFYVGVLGNLEPRAFPPIEIDFAGFPEGSPRIMDAKAKFDVDSPEYQGTKAVVADIDDTLKARLQKVALDAYHALRVRDYGRVDLRLTETGEIYVIEVNANCYLEKESEFAMSAAADGVEYVDLIGTIVDLAHERTRDPSPRRKKPRSKTAKVAT